ncbi:retrotransposon protein, putative, ty1-copia subclass [Tanacetum coccineum]|uniref:Retrotransposon protein, putative, ty1-copia subclass n=1 Tax=Tanacetum coccineum TaxID=301880 RepID=A0ABQ4ZM50_9ASTR
MTWGHLEKNRQDYGLPPYITQDNVSAAGGRRSPLQRDAVTTKRPRTGVHDSTTADLDHTPFSLNLVLSFFQSFDLNSCPLDQLDDNDLQDERQDQPEEEEVESRRSKRARTEKSFGPDFVSFMIENEPTSYREAVTSSEGHQWKEAIKSEIDYILQNHTWELVDLPSGYKPLGFKWIFKKKIKVDGTIDKYQARFVIKGFRQREGLDYFDTYSTNNLD